MSRWWTLDLPSRLDFQLVDVLVPVHPADVLELPLPLRPQAGLLVGVPDHIGGGADLYHVLPLQLRMLVTAHQVHVMPVCRGEGREGRRRRNINWGGAIHKLKSGCIKLR